MNISFELSKYRKDRNISFRKLAKELGMTFKRLFDIENNKFHRIYVDEALKMSKLFDVKIEDIDWNSPHEK